MDTVAYFTAIVERALWRAYDTHQELGAAGEALTMINQFGDTQLRADVACEAAVIAELEEQNLPVRVVSEEHKIVDITDNPRNLAVLDGIDGSGVYRQGRGTGRYGTMFAIYSSIDPCYQDYLAAGIMVHSPTPELVIASAGGGVRSITLNNTMTVQSSGATILDRTTKIYVDAVWNICKGVSSTPLAGFNIANLRSTSVHHADFATGRVDAVLECTRKRNLELGVSYGLVRESGGVMMTFDGTLFGPQRFLQFGQDAFVPVIIASSAMLAAAIQDAIALDATQVNTAALQ